MTALESQILQLGDDMRAEFSAIQHETTAAVDGVRTEIRAGDQEIREIRREMHALHQDVIEKISSGGKLGRISSGDEETRRYMRVLHEDVMERLSRIQEGPPPRRRKR